MRVALSTRRNLKKKNGDIVIPVRNIKRIDYKVPNFFNHLISSLVFDGLAPGYLRIHLIKKIEGKGCYAIKTKYKEFLNLPKAYRILNNNLNSVYKKIE